MFTNDQVIRKQHPHGGSFPIYVCTTPMMMIKRSGLNAEHWCKPTLTWTYSVFPALVVYVLESRTYCTYHVYSLGHLSSGDTTLSMHGYSVVCLLQIYELCDILVTSIVSNWIALICRCVIRNCVRLRGRTLGIVNTAPEWKARDICRL